MFDMLTKSKISDPAAQKALLNYKLKLIDTRRAEIHAVLEARAPGQIETFETQELLAELRDLDAQRHEAESVLRPPPPAQKSPELEAAYAAQRERDRANLTSAIRARTQGAVDWAEQLEHQGDYRQAKIARLQIPSIPENIIKEYGFDPALLGEIEL